MLYVLLRTLVLVCFLECISSDKLEMELHVKWKTLQIVVI